MPSDDREQQFERALARYLRERSSDLACPDAEVLAAYHERRLSLDEMVKWKEHIVACARCQETLSFAEQTENVDVEEWKEHNPTLVFDQAAAAPQIVGAAAVKFHGREEAADRTAAMTSPVVLAKRRPRGQWKWVVPVGAIAASVVVWIGASEIQKQRKETAAVQVAENRSARSPAPMPPAPQTDALEQKENEAASAKVLRDQSTVLRSVPPPAAVPAEAPDQFAARMKTAPRLPQSKEELDSKKDAQGEGSGYGNGVAATAPPAPAVSDALVKSRNELTPAANLNGAIVGGNVPAVPAERAKHAQLYSTDKGGTAVAAKPAAKSEIAGLSTIAGKVLDPSGAGISGAVITAIDTSTGNSRAAVADAAGNFQVTGLPADEYRVVVAHAGFAQSEQVLTLQSRRDAQLQIQLQLGTVAETVEVSGAATTVNTESDEISTARKNAKSSADHLSIEGRNFNQLLKLAASNPRYIVAPDQKLAWRVGQAGRIEHTSDGGKSWKVQNSGVSVDLRAGSATSDKVCWVIGKAGTILLTTDGGKHWKQLPSPILEDIGGIHASDTLHASIWDVPNRKSFETADGGNTWKRTANE